MKSQDVGIIFFSGHGHRDDDGIFYMLPAEVKRRSIDATGVDGALFKRKLAGIKGKLVVMLDACHSGAVEKEAGGSGSFDRSPTTSYGKWSGRTPGSS